MDKQCSLHNANLQYHSTWKVTENILLILRITPQGRSLSRYETFMAHTTGAQ